MGPWTCASEFQDVSFGEKWDETNIRPPLPPFTSSSILLLRFLFLIPTLTCACVPSRCCVRVPQMSQPFLGFSIKPTTKVKTSINRRRRGSFNGAPLKSSFENSFFFSRRRVEDFSISWGIKKCFFFPPSACQTCRWDQLLSTGRLLDLCGDARFGQRHWLTCTEQRVARSSANPLRSKQ